MDKIRVKRKDINARETIALNYCELQTLFRSESPIAYIAGIYGWDCDIYTVEGIDIATGYRTIGTRPPQAIIDRYKNEIKEIEKIKSCEESEKAYKNALINFTNEAYKNIIK